jgi:hypothetical protein
MVRRPATDAVGSVGSSVPGYSGFGLNSPSASLDSPGQTTENGGMEIRGRIRNGVVVLEGGPSLPEGAMVIVCDRDAPSTKPPETHRRVALPLVRSDRPGNRRLSAEDVAGLLASMGPRR